MQGKGADSRESRIPQARPLEHLLKPPPPHLSSSSLSLFFSRPFLGSPGHALLHLVSGCKGATQERTFCRDTGRYRPMSSLRLFHAVWIDTWGTACGTNRGDMRGEGT